MSEAIAVGCLGIIGHLLGQPSRMGELTESNEAQALELDDRPDFAGGTNLSQVATSQKQMSASVFNNLFSVLTPAPVLTPEEYDGWQYRWKFFVFRPTCNFIPIMPYD